MADKYTIGPDIDLDVEEVFVGGRRYTNADAEADSEYFEKRAGRPEAQVARQALLEYLARHRGA